MGEKSRRTTRSVGARSSLHGVSCLIPGQQGEFNEKAIIGDEAQTMKEDKTGDGQNECDGGSGVGEEKG